MPRVGVKKVKMTKSAAMTHSVINAARGERQRTFSPLNSRVSKIYAAAAQIKKIAIFSQSGDFPTAPL